MALRVSSGSRVLVFSTMTMQMESKRCADNMIHPIPQFTVCMTYKNIFAGTANHVLRARQIPLWKYELHVTTAYSSALSRLQEQRCV